MPIGVVQFVPALGFQERYMTHVVPFGNTSGAGLSLSHGKHSARGPWKTPVSTKGPKTLPLTETIALMSVGGNGHAPAAAPAASAFDCSGGGAPGVPSTRFQPCASGASHGTTWIWFKLQGSVPPPQGATAPGAPLLRQPFVLEQPATWMREADAL